MGVVDTLLTLSWIRAGTALTDWIAWSLVGLVLVVHIDVTDIPGPVVVTSTVPGHVDVCMSDTCVTVVGVWAGTPSIAIGVTGI
jgi:hypothetical protein